ncbi:membrane fusion protein, multidrug efflux system [Bosea sp. OK403]|uniref:HlyD family secretion protein n=1 Tax=Bosea sp. OK403 TaxID=1855286 RepID=UPI0008F0383F|nr:HlyD family secretion protein [Bosea sp. OK403]SFJ30157.1 membrane fusion protein, multidrug efflux system [Bosea sp. OK403]
MKSESQANDEPTPASNVTEIRRAASKLAPSAEATPQAEAPASKVVAAKRTGTRRRVLFALLPIALVVGGYFYVVGGQVMSTENAYVQADIVGLSTDVAGIVSDIGVHDNQVVKAGDVLFTLDDQQFRLALDRADAQIGIVKNDIAALQASYKGVQSQIVQAKIDIDFYTVAFKRQQDLATKSYASQAIFDQAKHDLDGAVQKLALLQTQLAGIAANLNGDPEAPATDHPRYKDAVAARGEAARQLAHTVVRAPMDGIVTNVPSLQKGQYLAAATNAFSLVSTDHVWIQASPKETELTWVRPGQKATVAVDSYPDQDWTGVVDSISPASAASFSLLPAQNTSGNWVKVVQRIAMRVRIETPADKPQLRAGMSVVLDIDTGHARGLPSFVSWPFGKSWPLGKSEPRHG